MVEWLDIYILIIALCFSAFFSGIEIAFISSDKLQIEVQAKSGDLTGRILSRFTSNQAMFLGTTLIGNSISLVVFGIYMTRLLVPWLVSISPLMMQNQVLILVEQTIVTTLIVLVTAEFLPKSLFLLNPNRILRALALPMNVVYYLLFVITALITGLSKWLIVNLLKLEYNDAKPVFGLTDLNNYIRNLSQNSADQAMDVDSTAEVDKKIFSNALELKSLRVRDCMIPRTEITAIDIKEDSIEELKNALIESGHSKILVFRESIDNVIGYCHALELFKKPTKLDDILMPIIHVPATMKAQDLMVRFISEGKSIAIVVDEYGGTFGVVSIEDIIEEITGEIEDEHDTEHLLERKLENGKYELSARLEIDYLNDKYLWQLPEGDYDTLGGLILSVTENIPQEGQIIVIGQFSIKIVSIEDNRIDKVVLEEDIKS